MSDTPQRCSPHGWTLDTLEKYLSEKLSALENRVNQDDDRNLERFASRQEAIKIAADAAKESSDRFREDMTARLKILDNIMPRDVFELQHKTVTDRIDTNTNRLNEIEKFVASTRTVKQEEREKLSTAYYALSIAGVVFAVIVSVVTIWYNISTFNSHASIAATVGEVEAGDRANSKRLDALAEQLKNLQK